MLTPNVVFGAAPEGADTKGHLVQHHDRELTLRLCSSLLGAPFGSCALAMAARPCRPRSSLLVVLLPALRGSERAQSVSALPPRCASRDYKRPCSYSGCSTIAAERQGQASAQGAPLTLCAYSAWGQIRSKGALSGSAQEPPPHT